MRDIVFIVKLCNSVVKEGGDFMEMSKHLYYTYVLKERIEVFKLL